jgi:hypothetical protein
MDMDDTERKAAVEIGYRTPAGPLIEHALAIKTIAQADLAAFKAEGLLKEDNLAKADDLISEVHKGLEDHTTASNEARTQTAGQAAALRDVKVARRRLGYLVDRAFAGKPELAQYRQSSTRSSGIAATCTDVNTKLAFAKERQTQLAPFGVTAAFLAQLEANVRALEQSSGSQNAAIAQLPDSMRAFCEAKGRLYLAIKDIISAGHALHAGNLEAAAKYNAKRLYAKTGKAKVEGAGETGTTGTTGTTEKK